MSLDKIILGPGRSHRFFSAILLNKLSGVTNELIQAQGPPERP
jgi:hypothetical protein